MKYPIRVANIMYETLHKLSTLAFKIRKKDSLNETILHYYNQKLLFLSMCILGERSGGSVSKKYMGFCTH